MESLPAGGDGRGETRECLELGEGRCYGDDTGEMVEVLLFESWN